MTDFFEVFKAKKKKGFVSCVLSLERQDNFHHVLSKLFFSRAQHNQRLHHLKRNCYTRHRCLEYHSYDLQVHEL